MVKAVKSLAVSKVALNRIKNSGNKVNKVKKTAKKVSRSIKKKAIKKLKRENSLKQQFEDRGVVYVSHIPHGFYEMEMYNYFKQFGRVTAIRMPRSRNGKAKGYAFIEFEYKEVAKVVADTMNNYLMFNRLLKTEYIPPEKQKPHFFYRASMPWNDITHKQAVDKRRKIDRKSKNRLIGDEGATAFAKKTKQKLMKLHKNLMRKTGADYEFQINDEESIITSGTREGTAGSYRGKKSTSPTAFDGLDIERIAAAADTSHLNSTAKSKKRQLPVLEVDESDEEIRFKPPPNVITKIIKSSKSKLKAADNKIKSGIKRNKTIAMTDKRTKEKVKALKDKVKTINKRVISTKDVVSKLKKSVKIKNTVVKKQKEFVAGDKKSKKNAKTVTNSIGSKSKGKNNKIEKMILKRKR